MLEITCSPSAQRPLPEPIPVTLQMSKTPRQLPQSHKQLIPQMPVRIPQVHFPPIPGGLQNSNAISQEAINFLTKCIWAKSPDIFTLNKLMPAATPTCLDFEQVAMPVVHPVTGKTISSYKCLMKDPTTAEMWQTAFARIMVAWHKASTRQGNRGLTLSLS